MIGILRILFSLHFFVFVCVKVKFHRLSPGAKSDWLFSGVPMLVRRLSEQNCFGWTPLQSFRWDPLLIKLQRKLLLNQTDVMLCQLLENFLVERSLSVSWRFDILIRFTDLTYRKLQLLVSKLSLDIKSHPSFSYLILKQNKRKFLFRVCQHCFLTKCILSNICSS